MSIFKVNLKRILKSKVQLFFLFLFPLAIMSLAVFHYEQLPRVAVVDQDGTELTRSLIQDLETIAKVSPLEEKDMEKELMTLKAAYVLRIPQGFTDGLIGGKDTRLKGYFVKESNMSLPAKSYVEGYLANVKQIAQAAGGNRETFYKGLELYRHGSVKMENHAPLNEEFDTSRSVFGYLVLSMMYASMITGMLILMNKNNRTLYRTLTAPVTIRQYMLQNVASLIVVGILQIALLFVILKFGFHVYFGTSLLHMFALFLVFAVVCVSIGIAISAYAKTIVQACIIGVCIIPPMAMLGGAYWPTEMVPESVRTVAQFVPVTWMMQAVESLLREQPLAEIGRHLLILLLFAVVFFLLGTLRKTDIAK